MTKPTDRLHTLCRTLRSEDGFSLIELVIILMVISIVLTVAMQSVTTVVDSNRHTETEREMELLARGIVGDPTITVDGIRSDFGYVGDIGAFPVSLSHLVTNSGGMGTWNGPYVPAGFDSSIILQDAWGSAYTFNGTEIVSTGSGATLTHRVTSTPGDYLINTYTGIVSDLMHQPPGIEFADSIDIVVQYPDGAGSTLTRTVRPDPLGAFALDSLPAGVHSLLVIYTPDLDTLRRFITVLPRHPSTPDQYLFASSYFGGGGTPPPTGGTETLILRPIANGATTELADENCSNNWPCVAESVSDGDGTFVKGEGNNWKTDLYQLEDPGISSGTIDMVTIWVNCKGNSSHKIKTIIRTNGSTVEGNQENTSGSYQLYSTAYSANPVTGSAWTWAEINNLQGGITIRREAFCTQVWVEVVYTQ